MEVFNRSEINIVMIINSCEIAGPQALRKWQLVQLLSPRLLNKPGPFS